MKRETLDRRKQFAAEVAERDRTPRVRAGGGHDRKPSVAQERTPTDKMLLFARASVARRLVADGVIDGELALALAVWPSDATLEREQLVGYGTLTGRAFGTRGNA